MALDCLKDQYRPRRGLQMETSFESVEGDSIRPQSVPEPSTMEPKVFKDPIHGHMEFRPLLVEIIDTPQFQRLRYLKQLGGSYFVYPGASHNRFEHSLGVAHLARQLVRSLKEKQQELDINDRDILCVEIAGLCHDLGHGPFSHMFDGMFMPKAQPETGWTHEEASVKMLDDIVDKLENLKLELKNDEEGDDLQFIKEMINGPDEMGHYRGRPSNKSFLYEIVSNKRNGLDVDKFDYFARDCHHLGIKNSFDHNRYIKFARVIEVDGQKQICTRDKELSNVYEMFHTRSSLHRKAYQHKTNKIIEVMITDALLKADPVLQEKISEAKDDMNKYMQLTDNIFEKILYSTGEDLKEAREILQNIQSRKLYTYLGKIKMTDELGVVQEDTWKSELAAMPTYSDEKQLTKDDFGIIITTIDFGKKDKNPMENVYFYNKFDSNKAFKIPSEQVSQFLMPKKFSEKWISVYCKSSDKNTLTVARKNFDEWCHRKKLYLSPRPPQLLTADPLPKVFNDPIHGHMEFHPLLVKILDTPEFQRLRYIKQLGGAYFVYPGASHNRFEHSLGVAHLAGQFLKSLQDKQPGIIDDKDILCVQIAGLCYDLGHGPFPEWFDTSFLQKECPEIEWEKSTASANIFNEKMKQNLLGQNIQDETLTPDDMTFIEEIIKGIDVNKDTPRGRVKEKHFLYDIVSNKRSGVGVKLFDSVARDCYHLGLNTNFDLQRFIKLAKVENNQLFFRDKVMGTMHDLSHTIFALHNKAYQHIVSMSIQLMMSDIIEKQLVHMVKGKNRAEATEIYSNLTDSLFGERTTEELLAKDIVERIHSRDLYKYVTKVKSQGVNREECIGELAAKLQIEPDTFGISVSNMNFDPLCGMNFIDKSGKTITLEEMDKKTPKMDKPETYSGQWIHVFSKKHDLKDKAKDVEDCLSEWMAKQQPSSNQRI